ncbi:endolytic transglycosylase MltG [Paenibacillus yanchengensis]|uniref:Endolytic murein transglycosylase n=1 Tax=Paenibacillus yanchengensis TaxID=2035833 RepID=A0ABW4YL63_9BACL
MEKEQKNKRIRKRKPGPRIWLINLSVSLTLLALMVLTAAGGAFYLWNSLQPTKKGEPVEFEVTKGMSANKVSDELESKGLIKNATIFSYYLQFKKEGSRFQAGHYSLTPGMDKSDIIAKLNAGDTLKPKTIRFTIPEGFTVAQIANKLADEQLINKETFLQLTNTNRSWGDVEAVQNLPENANLKNRLEGYLFPDTYEMKIGSNEEDIIARLLLEMDRKLSTLPDGWQDALDDLGLNFHEMLIVASLVEREVVADEERPIVAGVILNRLAKPMRLEIDATIQYVLDEQKERLLLSDLEIESPYNTYRNDGLPPGPIASPSLASIEAVLYPEKTDYLFYVTKKDGTQTHYFAKTFEEHKKNIAKSNESNQ